ncbi:MAG TPA: methionine--tRNA ligase [Acidiferrobacteraceae bacterium]|nr:methionine--tRNA ligase [Acidiferrobacteraceae bacterium]
MLVTSALPYANGPIHLGHLVEHIQTDIWVRFHRMRGDHCIFVCADDTHGTPIMLRAERENISPEALITAVAREHQQDFADFAISFDHFHSTHSSENQALCNHFYQVLEQHGHIVRRRVRQPYDPKKAMFLPDRFVRGTCPRCNAPDQYGDSCEACGATYAPADLKNAVSALSGATPEWRESEHHFFRLADFEASLRAWVRQGPVQEQAANKLDEWFDAGLMDWDISRDAPYFGFEIPGAPGKYFYVWLDAPIGYLASLWAWHKRQQQPASIAELQQLWGSFEVHHFIGKDILYFHTLFWPALLEGAGFSKPAHIHAHGFLTVDGLKMSKSRGTFIKARTYLNHLPAEALRYYVAAKLNGRIEDIDLNLEDFANRVNSDLVGKIVNIASRCATLLERHHGSQLGDQLPEPELYTTFTEGSERIAAAYDRLDYARAMREIMTLADRANQYIDQQKPWVLARAPEHHAALQGVCTQGLNLFRVLIGYLKPVVPRLAQQAETFLGIPELRWGAWDTPLLSQRIAPYQHLMGRLQPPAIAALREEARADAAHAEAAPTARPTLKPTIQIEDVQKLDLRVGTVRSAEVVTGSDRLLRLRVDLGPYGERTVLAGIRQAYAAPEALVGRQVVVVANLAPRTLRFGTSEGMILAAGTGSPMVFLLTADEGAEPGMEVR